MRRPRWVLAALVLALAAPQGARAGCFGKFFDKLGGRGGFASPSDQAAAFIAGAGGRQVEITLADGTKVRGQVSQIQNSDEVMVFSGGGNGNAMMGRRFKLADIQAGGFSLTEGVLPNGARVGLEGDQQFVSWASPGATARTPGRVTRIYTDAKGAVHVEVEEITAAGVSAPRELTAEELQSTKFSRTSKEAYAARAPRPAAPAAPAPRQPVAVSEHAAPTGRRISTSGDGQYISFQDGPQAQRVPGRVRRMWTDANGQLHVEAEVWVPAQNRYEVRELTQTELSNVKPSSTAKSQFGGGAAAHEPPPAHPPAQHAPMSADAEARSQAIRKEFPPGSPSRTSNGGQKMVPTPSGGRAYFFYDLKDEAYARKMGRIFDDVSPGSLPRGKKYTYVVTADGHVSFGMVNDSWEFGVKHMHIARGRAVVAAGEVEVTAAGQIRFNLESGTFTARLVDSGLVKQETLASKVNSIFARDVGAANVTEVGGGDILTQAYSGRMPQGDELQRLCASPEFAANRASFCP